tara:strand:+ start:2237 stop:2338 length:102 start_codon:yes stop_codon:yes gene_type:complete
MSKEETFTVELDDYPGKEFRFRELELNQKEDEK